MKRLASPFSPAALFLPSAFLLPPFFCQILPPPAVTSPGDTVRKKNVNIIRNFNKTIRTIGVVFMVVVR